MPDIIFQDGKIYSVEPPEKNFQYQDNGDRWGNTRIKFEFDSLTVECILKQIAPQVLPKTIAVLLNNQLVGIKKRVTENSSLHVILSDDKQGRVLSHYVYTFLIMKYVYEKSNYSANVLEVRYSEENFECFIKTDSFVSKDGLYNWLYDKITAGESILYMDQYQKARALELYPSIQQPYVQDVLNNVDEYEFLDLIVFDGFALMSEFPISLSLSCIKMLKTLIIEGTENNLKIWGAV